MKPLLIIFTCCIFFYGCKSQNNKPSAKKQDNNNTLLWQVSGNGLTKPSYIFGTFHLLCKGDIQFSEQLKKSLAYADEIYMEMDIDDPSTMLGGLLYMNMRDGKKLKHHRHTQ